MDLVDDHGRLFGIVNVIDALVLLVVLLGVVGAIGLLTSGGVAPSDDSRTVTVTFRAEDLEPYVASAIPEGDVAASGVIAVENKTVQPSTVFVRTANGTLRRVEHPRNRTVQFDATLSAKTATDGGADYRFDGKPIEIGRRLTLDVGAVSVSGRIVRFEVARE